MRPPDIKQQLLPYLSDALGVPAYSTRPDGPDAPPRFVRITATGGDGRHSRVAYTVQLTIDSYAESTGRAARLAMDVDEAMHDLPASPLPVTTPIVGTAPAESPDPDTAQARYTATYQLPTIIQ